MKLTNKQWEAVAASLQYRVLAIHTLASISGRKATIRFKDIRDLCKLPYKELVEKGLLDDHNHSGE